MLERSGHSDGASGQHQTWHGRGCRSLEVHRGLRELGSGGLASADKCVQANAKPQESPAERSAKIVAAIMDRCPKETDCFDKQMAAFGRMMNLPSGSAQEDAFYRCTSAADKFE